MKKIRNILMSKFLFLSLFIVAFTCCKKADNSNPANGTSKIVFNPSITYGTMTDQDGNTYKTVTIGTQTWMAENLRTTKFRDGTAIPLTLEFTWDNINTPVYGNYMDQGSYAATYGRLYNWYAVTDSRNIAPVGWHVPTFAEWKTLSDYLGNSVSIGGELKETDTIHWSSPNAGATNVTGFTALPGGQLNANGPEGMSSIGRWWCSSEYNSTEAWSWYLKFNDIGLFDYTFYKYWGCSVRCVKD